MNSETHSVTQMASRTLERNAKYANCQTSGLHQANIAVYLEIRLPFHLEAYAAVHLPNGVHSMD